MRTAQVLSLPIVLICLLACGNGSDADDPGSDAWKAAYAEEHITFLNTMHSKKVDSNVGPLFEFVSRFQVKNSGDQEFSGRFKGNFSLAGNRGQIPYEKDFTVEPGGEAHVEVMFRHTRDGVSATCTEMVPR